jgi:hypothetical protein
MFAGYLFIYLYLLLCLDGDSDFLFFSVLLEIDK